MTNNINGIDVSECGFCCWKHNVNELIENYCALFNNKCICNPDCYFKQLKRLQEENGELKERFNELYNNAEKLANKYNKYGGNKENELVEIINKTTDEMNKYRQALEEIRDRLIVVTEEEPRSTKNLVLDLKPIIEGVLK